MAVYMKVSFIGLYDYNVKKKTPQIPFLTFRQRVKVKILIPFSNVCVRLFNFKSIQ